MKMHARFLVHGDPARSSFRKRRNELIRIFNHQVAIKDGVGKGLPQRLHNQWSNREIRYEMSVHHVAMNHGAAAVERGLRVFAQPCEVCGENRGCQFNGHELRAAPSLPRRKQIIRASSSMLLEKCDSKRESAHHHGIVQRFWLLARASSSKRITFNAYSGVTAGPASPKRASRTFA